MMQARDIRPVCATEPVRVEPVTDRESGGVVGYMVVDASGVNCVRHAADPFPLIMSRQNADTILSKAAAYRRANS